MKKNFKLIISYIIRLSLLVAVAREAHVHQYAFAFFSSLAFFASFLPGILARNAKIILPTEMELTALFFIYIGLFLGEAHNLYDVFPWLDIVLHLTSGIIMGLVGFFIVYILNTDPKTHIKMEPLFVAVFSFTFSMSIGAIWEIVEFSLDTLYAGLNMQKSGLADTMGDLIMDFSGAMIVAIMSYFYLKKNEKGRILNWIKKRIAHHNPKIFGAFR